nr:MAG TPA: hypothetical protein [Caudoviricetes sp.]
MDYYKNIIKDKLNEFVDDGEETREQILTRWAEGDMQDDFGNYSGSRTCNAADAEKALIEAGFPFNSDITDLLIDAGYELDIVNRGAEVVDVVICELLAPVVANELLDAEN